MAAGQAAVDLPGSGLEPGSLPERAGVHWRRRVDDASLRRGGRWWTLTAVAHSAPFVVAAGLMIVFNPVLIPVAIALLIHAWAIPELYAARGANVVRRHGRTTAGAERRAMLLLGDLIADPARRLHARTGLVVERGELGTWILGEAGALLVRPGGRRVDCLCVKATGADLPAADRIAHLLLALRCDERDFATVANVAFSGAAWRVRRRLRTDQRPALDAARRPPVALSRPV